MSKSTNLSQQALALVRSRRFWIVVAMLVGCAFFHYFTPQARLVPFFSLPLTRRAVDRIIFLLPVTAAAYAFGHTGGLITLGVSILVMLPRALLSSSSADATFETLGIAVVGYIIIWMIEAQEKEKKLRHKAAEDLQVLNTVSATLCQSLELDDMLEKVLEKLLEIVDTLEPRGAILLLDPWGQNLNVRVHKGLQPGFEEQAKSVPLGECLCGRAAESGEVLIVTNALNDPRHTRCLEPSPHSHACIPLWSRDRLLGVVDLYLKEGHPIDVLDRQLFASIGRQIGGAVENARLCENLRFYVGQITRAQEDERQRIARELHDDTAQGLVDLSRRLDALAAADEPAEATGDRLDDLHQRIDTLLQDLRRFGRDLRPSVLDDFGLLPALDGLLPDLRDQGIEPLLQTKGESRRLSEDAELALYRIVQEALNNVKRHAGASRVTITVEFEEKRVKASIEDDGRGFERPARVSDLVVMGRYGIVGIQERAHLLRGHLSVQSELGKGTTVAVDVPA